MRGLLDDCRQTHFVEHIQVIVAWRAVCTQAEVNMVMKHARRIGDAGGQLEVRARAVADMNPAVPQNPLFLLIQPDTVS